VRVSHSESIYARFVEPVTPEDARRLLADASSITLQDDPISADYPLAIHAEGRDEVFVGRVRQVPGDDRGLLLWVVSDNLRKGAATNAVQIAEIAAAAVSDTENKVKYA
jgi:aspartate-semialdehyde dehydrogenase